ncbi:MAG: hypothetical protein SWZ49_04615 [Cyanobacteriota bacterium]|nr:hypothetical protein [Cyanobacteriota bacterium]
MNINKYKFSNAILNLIVSSIFLFLVLFLFFDVKAKAANPNGVENKAEPGWSLWMEKDEAKNADFDSGFSNLELGGYLEFEQACKTSSGLPESQTQYWFRLSDRVNRIGTGTVEYACWDGKRFLHTYTSTAIKSSLEYVDCLQVKSPAGGVLIWSESTLNSKLLRVIANGQTVKPGYFPATITNDGNRNWVNISSPVEGWISDGNFAGEGNLRLCK